MYSSHCSETPHQPFSCFLYSVIKVASLPSHPASSDPQVIGLQDTKLEKLVSTRVYTVTEASPTFNECW